MANAENFYIGANDEHGMNPPTANKRTPLMPYINRSFFENEFNRPTKNFFLAACVRNGFRVYDVKPEQTDVSISSRVTRVNRQRLTLVVTFAYNATANSEFNAVNGYIVFYSAENNFATASRLLAYDVSSGMSQTVSTKNLGINTLLEIGMLRSVNCPAVLPECGFMTNFNEAKLMVDPDFQTAMAEGVCIGVCNSLSVPYFAAVNYAEMPTLRRGNRGQSVKYMQYLLIENGYNISADGVFGNNSENAVRNFQLNNRLTVDGIVGQDSWQILLKQLPTLPVLKLGNRGTYVRYLQQKLLSKLYFSGKIDGVFGHQTLIAVKVFQEENGLIPDGIVGAQTWTKVTPIGGGRPLPP